MEINLSQRTRCGEYFMLLSSKPKMPKKVVVKQAHLHEAFNSTRPSLSSSDVTRYQRTYARFTNKEKASRDVISKRATLA